MNSQIDHPQTKKESAASFVRIGNFILLIYFLTAAGLLAELLLLDHYEGFWQILPIVLLALSMLVMTWYYLSNNAASRKTVKALMYLLIISGIWGTWLHYSGNTEFELEMRPSIAGFKLFWKSMKGATPVLAPGAIIGLGLTGWVYTMLDKNG